MFDLFALNCPLLVEGIIIVQKYRVCHGIKSESHTYHSMIIRKNREIKEVKSEAGIKIGKGQLISECLFDILNFPKKNTKNLTNFCPRM